VFAVVPVMMFVAILRHRLWDIDVVASRALLVAALLGFVSVIYVGVVALAGLLLRGRGWVVLVPLVVVACVAEPVRERCQALCNRLVFGQRLSPREAVGTLVERFSGVGDVDELTELTRVVVHSTRATDAAIWLTGPGRLFLLARHPADPVSPTEVDLAGVTFEQCRDALRPAESWPVTYHGELLAVIATATPRGVHLTGKESRLLDDLSRHAGLLVANAKLTVDLQRELAVVSARTAELRGSRQELVLAQDRRRRQLERDIHDGAQQQLVAFLLVLRTQRRRTGSDRVAATGHAATGHAAHAAGEHAAAGLATARSVLTGTQETLALLSTGGAPAVLVESGLGAALEEAATASRMGPTVQIHVTGPVEGVEVRTAVYFCCLEALQNAVKHADASRILIGVESDGHRLMFSITDDGTGFDASLAGTGSGLGNLADRLEPLGGRVEVLSSPGRGTTVRGTLPLTGSPADPDRAESSARTVTP
jgi:signal transduction histidine kinase